MAIIVNATTDEFERRNVRQASVYAWANEAFGGTDSSPRIRSLRLVEEAIEVAQTEGVTLDDIMRVASVVLGRPIGEHHAEIGGVSVTLMAYAESRSLSVAACEETEIVRVNSKPIEHFQRRQREKAEQGMI